MEKNVSKKGKFRSVNTGALRETLFFEILAFCPLKISFVSKNHDREFFDKFGEFGEFWKIFLKILETCFGKFVLKILENFFENF